MNFYESSLMSGKLFREWFCILLDYQWSAAFEILCCLCIFSCSRVGDIWHETWVLGPQKYLGTLPLPFPSTSKSKKCSLFCLRLLTCHKKRWERSQCAMFVFNLTLPLSPSPAPPLTIPIPHLPSPSTPKHELCIWFRTINVNKLNKVNIKYLRTLPPPLCHIPSMNIPPCQPQRQSSPSTSCPPLPFHSHLPPSIIYERCPCQTAKTQYNNFYHGLDYVPFQVSFNLDKTKIKEIVT